MMHGKVCFRFIFFRGGGGAVLLQHLVLMFVQASHNSSPLL